MKRDRKIKKENVGKLLKNTLGLVFNKIVTNLDGLSGISVI